MKNDDPKEKSGRSLWAKLRSGTGVDRGEGGKEAGPSAATPPPAPTAGAGAKPARQAPQPKERWATSDLGAFVEKLEFAVEVCNLLFQFLDSSVVVPSTGFRILLGF